jgi:hypothetical protein
MQSCKETSKDFGCRQHDLHFRENEMIVLTYQEKCGWSMLSTELVVIRKFKVLNLFIASIFEDNLLQ